MTGCYEELKALRAKHGTSNFDHAVKKLNRERLEMREGEL